MSQGASFALQKFLDVRSRNCFGSARRYTNIFLDYTLPVICIDRAYVEAYKATKALSSPCSTGTIDNAMVGTDGNIFGTALT